MSQETTATKQEEQKTSELQQQKKEEQKPQQATTTTKEEKKSKPEKENFEMVINFRRVIMGRKTTRTKRAIKYVRYMVKRHFGAEKVIIDPLLAKAITINGRDKIVRRVRIAVKRIGEKTYLARLAIKSE
ncbi:50S ribosomal protein L31 [Sulfolobus acidocaldarius SUSAZ]|nr:50S ribosomal protein L31 [Sulfolobus acidocaldarius SUSAZ]